MEYKDVDPPQFFFSESFPVTMVESVGGVPVVLDRLKSAQYHYNSSWQKLFTSIKYWY